MTVPDLGFGYLVDPRPIGEGGFGSVYAATDMVHDRRVAVKILRDLPATATGQVAAFDRERRAMGRLSGHPNIVTLFQTGYTADDEPYLVMELVDGGSLGDRLAASGPLGWAEAVALIIPVCRALDHAHLHGVLHRDIKPGNILVHQGTPKLADFGIARLVDSGHTTSTMALSLAHAAPETFSAHRDTRSDIYSLVSTLYHLIAGHHPFYRGPDDLDLAVITRIVSQPPTPLGPARVPPALDQLLLRGLAKNPDHRPQTAGQLQTELEAVTVSAPQPPRWPPINPPGINQPIGPADPIGTRKRYALWAMAPVVAALTGALIVAVVLFLRPDNPTDRVGTQEATNQVDPSASTPVQTPDTGALGTGSSPPASAAAVSLVRTLTGHSDVVTTVAWLSDGRLVTAAKDNTVIVWDTTTGQPTGRFTGHTDAVWDIAETTDGRIATASWDGTVQVWNPDDPTAPPLVLPHRTSVWSVASLPTGQLVTGDGAGLLNLWSLDGSLEPDIGTFLTKGAITSLAVTDGDLVIATSTNGTVTALRQQAESPWTIYEDHSDEVWDVAVLPNGRVATASKDDTVRIWSPTNPTLEAVTLTHPGPVWAVATIGDGLLVTGCEDGTVRIWDPARPDHELTTYNGHTQQVITVDTTPQGLLATGSWDTTAQIEKLN